MGCEYSTHDCKRRSPEVISVHFQVDPYSQAEQGVSCEVGYAALAVFTRHKLNC
ncbi:hypothetical protein [Nostoc sp. T09]|uniref:hypothetical protein n=1 Tax=Nostoc sp. T09 TaxID=1932621 RepID=UPI0015C51C47|nr:hypothetical protein [Nostoc sp. T09]